MVDGSKFLSGSLTALSAMMKLEVSDFELLSLQWYSLAMLPYGLDSNVTKFLANLLTKLSVFYYFANFIL